MLTTRRKDANVNVNALIIQADWPSVIPRSMINDGIAEYKAELLKESKN